MMKPQIFLWGDPTRYRNYLAAVTAAGGTVCCSLEGTEAEGCAGLLLPGGGDLEPWRYGQLNIASKNLEPERDRAEWSLLRQFVTSGRPVLGVCRGMQTINVFFGGTLVQDLLGHSDVMGVDRLHRVFTARSSLRDFWGKRPVVNSAHHQAVGCLGEELLALQWAPDGTVEAICHKQLPILAVQWHPERLRGALSKAGAADGQVLFDAFVNLCAAHRTEEKNRKEKGFDA